MLSKICLHQYDFSGFTENKCLRILQANNWNLEFALDLALDGAYNDDYADEMTDQLFNSNNRNDSSDDISNLRHRNIYSTNAANISAISSSTNSSSFSTTENSFPATTTMPDRGDSRDSNATNDGYLTVIWNNFTWLLQMPFTIAMEISKTFFNFFFSMFLPTLHYDKDGTVERFIAEFEEKYGHQHPQFFRGSYSQAMDAGKRDIRFVLIFLYSSSNKDIDLYCRTIITDSRFITFINNENMIFWSCSIDYPEGYKAFQSLKINNFPAINLIGLQNNKMIVMKKIEGFQTLDSILSQLQTAINNNVYSLMAARLDRQERDMASLIRAQQDAAFEESLKADQAKDRKKREEKEQRELLERIKEEKFREESQRKEKLLRMKTTLLDHLKTEPDSDDQNSLKIMFKLPNGTRLARRFLRDDPIKLLYYFVYCKEESLFNFKLRTNFPTRDLPGHSPEPENDGTETKEMNLTLNECELVSNIVLFVHDLDS
ncbi:FAS-associated factor 2-B-like protein [Sarcoptes scabiei]|uniref:FAS-associated factor 2-B-like protein n=1 Tax=Sarcoptes scabiei TaxID=52283 RepID=A0A132ACM6_SARSC|nr:FAS-associated factor 2-B-like protein [Sarcoptes scabiei]